MERQISDIERESYEILRSRVDTSGLPPWTRAVVERVVHASADLDYVADLRVCAEDDLAAAAAALRVGAAVVADVRMVASGLAGTDAVCRLGDPRADAIAAEAGVTRTAAAVRVAAEEVGPGAIWVIGCAPTALAELLTLDAAPTLVIGLPVGFVGAVEAKQALRDTRIPAVTNLGEKGGSAVAAAAFNALRYEVSA